MDKKSLQNNALRKFKIGQTAFCVTDRRITLKVRGSYINAGIALLFVAVFSLNIFFMVERGIWGAYFFLALALLSFWGGLILLGMKVITILDKDLGYARIVMIWGYCYKATNIRVPGTATPSLRKLKRTVKSSDFYDVEIEYPGFMSARNLGTFDLSAQAELAINEVLQWKETRG